MAEKVQLDRAEDARVAMRQSWHELTFLHFAVEPELVQAALPPGLEVETYDGQAWIGLVLFRMSGIRPPRMPAAPWLSAFPETNVRTYVVHEGVPGVWFFSLEAARWLACVYARLAFGLPYFHAGMTVTRNADELVYRSQRRGATGVGADMRVKVEGGAAPALPGSFDHWLIERYRLFALRRGQLLTGEVWHEPYRLRRVVSVGGEQSLTAAAGFPARPWTHQTFCEGVEVEVFSPRVCD